MRRQHPVFSPVGCLGGATLLAGLTAAILFTGGEIFSPGPLTAWAARGTPIESFASHAAFEADCRLCHAPWQGVSAERCESCHASVAEERRTGAPLHGRLPEAQVRRCGACHPDHLGRDADPNAPAVRKFDHAVTGFSLARHILDYDRAALDCGRCHPGSGYEADQALCATCHGAHDLAFLSDHVTAFGEACVACHDGVDKTNDFDHARLDFALEGRHAAAACARCHAASVPATETPTDCAGCHAEPAAHAGVFAASCADCHTAEGWSPARLAGHADFAHTRTMFQLVTHTRHFDGAPLTCAGCHPGAAAGDFAPDTQVCADCHAQRDAGFMAQHLADYGPKCVSCHDGTGNMKNFDHAQVFALDGAHAPLACADCHVDQVFRGTPRECAGCHAEPEVHAGMFGTRCTDCHTAAAWAPAQLTRHTFPLDHGGQGETACAVCHPSAYVEYTCYGCHDHEPDETARKHREDGIGADRLPQCAACHPAGREDEGGGSD